jgi:hypothetical protein
MSHDLTQSDLNQVTAKIKKLLRMAERGTEHEAIVAAQKAQELMTRYNVSVLAGTAIDEDLIGEAIDREYLTEEKRLPHWKLRISLPLAQSNYCQVFQSKRGLVILGKAHNRMMAKNLFDYLVSTIDRLCQENLKVEKQRHAEYSRHVETIHGYARANPHNWRKWANDFRTGAAVQVAERLKEQYQNSLAYGIPADEQNQTAVSALAVQDAHKQAQNAITRYLKSEKIQLKSSSRRNILVGNGFQAGQQQGEMIGLDKQVGAAQTVSGRYLGGSNDAL